MKTDNELIAEFMGMTCVKTAQDTFWHPTEKCTLKNWKYHSFDLDHFYSKSWDWLHPVWDKWRRVAKGYPGYHGWMHSLKESMTMKKVNQAHKQLVKAIKWYNQLKEV